jgi:Raf kinase inhibitor-like YbhB/YbcL family protein
MDDLKIASSTFENNGHIPSKYTCDGENINPLLKISGVDENVKSLVLIMDDPDSPTGIWDHWIIFNLDPSIKEIKEGEKPNGVEGINSWGNIGYGGPCPGSGEHRYFFNLYSLDAILDLKEGSTKKETEKAMENHVLQETKIIGLYKRN